MDKSSGSGDIKNNIAIDGESLAEQLAARQDAIAHQEWLAAQRQDFVARAETIFRDVFERFSPTRFIKAGLDTRRDGRPAIDLDPASDSLKVGIKFWVDKDEYDAWLDDALRRLVPIANSTSDASRFRGNLDNDASALQIGDTILRFDADLKESLLRALRHTLKDFPLRVGIFLLDGSGSIINRSFAELARNDDHARNDGRNMVGGHGGFFALGRRFYADLNPRTEVFTVPNISPVDLRSLRDVKCEVRPSSFRNMGVPSFSLRDWPVFSLGDGVGLEMIRLPNGLYMGTYPVTQVQYKAVMGGNPSEFKGWGRPVEKVSWNDCQEFLRRLNGLDVVNGGTSCLPQFLRRMFVPGDISCLEFRLPTAEEWEYACRAGARGDYCRLANGTEVTEETLGTVAWYGENSDDHTHPVGLKQPNAYGLYDMHGNVWEWTSSANRYGNRVFCGGCWSSSAGHCRAGYRHGSYPDSRDDCLGFRLAARERTTNISAWVMSRLSPFGKASRLEFALMLICIFAIALALVGVGGHPLLFIPLGWMLFSVIVRRARDCELSWAWFIFAVLPLGVAIPLLMLLFLPSRSLR